MKINGAIFDMDGTLLNSMDYWATVAEEFLISKGISPDKEANKRFLETGMKEFTKYYNENYNLGMKFDEVMHDIYLLMGVRYDNDVFLKDGALELLERFKNDGVKMCLATATEREQVEKILKKLGIESYFSKIFTTREVGVGKAFPLIYEKALEFLGTEKSDTLIFEDAVYAMKTARNAGFLVVGIYDKNVLVPKNEVKLLCDYYLDEGDRYNLKV